MSGMFAYTTETQNIRLIASTQPIKKEARIIVGNQTDYPSQVRMKLTSTKPALSLLMAKQNCNTGDQSLDSSRAMLDARIEQADGDHIIRFGALATWEAAELVIRIED